MSWINSGFWRGEKYYLRQYRHFGWWAALLLVTALLTNDLVTGWGLGPSSKYKNMEDVLEKLGDTMIVVTSLLAMTLPVASGDVAKLRVGLVDIREERGTTWRIQYYSQQIMIAMVWDDVNVKAWAPETGCFSRTEVSSPHSRSRALLRADLLMEVLPEVVNDWWVEEHGEVVHLVSKDGPVGNALGRCLRPTDVIGSRMSIRDKSRPGTKHIVEQKPCSTSEGYGE